MLQDVVRNLHYALTLSNTCRLSRNVEQLIEALRAVFDLLGKTFLTPTIFFIDRTTILSDDLGELVDDSVRSFLFHRLNDKYDFVLSHEITSLFGLWLLLEQEQRLKRIISTQNYICLTTRKLYHVKSWKARKSSQIPMTNCSLPVCLLVR